MGMDDNKTRHEDSDGSIGAATNRDLNRGNPNGDVVDNTAGANPSKDTSKTYKSGAYLSGVARAPHLSGIQKY